MKGQRRLAITVDRDIRRYCTTCATTTLDAAERRLVELRAALESDSH